MFYIGRPETYSGISARTEEDILALSAFKKQFDNVYGDLETQISAKTVLTNLKGIKQVTFIHNPASVKIWLNGSKLIKTTPDDTAFTKGDFYSSNGTLFFTSEFTTDLDVIEIESEGLVELSTPQIQEQVPVGTSVTWQSTQPIPTGFIAMSGQTKEQIAVHPELLIKFPNGLPNIANTIVKAFSVLTGGGTKNVEAQLKQISELMMSATASSVPAGITAQWTSDKPIPTGWLPLWGQSKTDLAMYPVALKLYPDGFPDTRDNDNKFNTFFIVKIYDYAHMPEAADFSYVVQQLKPKLDAFDPAVFISSGRLIGKPQVFTANGTYTPSANAKFCIVEVQGAGGGGGDATGTASTVVAGTSGSAGAYARSHVPITLGTAAIVVGAGGNANTAGANSSFTGFGETIVANGGKAGVKNLGNVANTVSTIIKALDGSVGTGANILNAKGGASQPTVILNGTVLTGNGGDSHFAGGALGAAAGENGVAGILGSGGSAAAVNYSATTKTGGKGGNGVVIIWEYA